MWDHFYEKDFVSGITLNNAIPNGVLSAGSNGGVSNLFHFSIECRPEARTLTFN